MTTINQYTAKVELLEYSSTKALETVSGTTLTITGHGMITGDFIVNSSRRSSLQTSAERGSRKITRVDNDTFTINAAIAGQTVGDSIMIFTWNDKTSNVLSESISLSLAAEGRDSASFRIKASEV